jgi:hypothetical protein
LIKALKKAQAKALDEEERLLEGEDISDEIEDEEEDEPDDDDSDEEETGSCEWTDDVKS